jgi:hypothetical protein
LTTPLASGRGTSDILDGCWAKLSGAEELTDALGSEIERVRRGSYLRFSIGGEDGICIRVHVHKQPPLQRWSVQVGEIVHDLRSALDHLSWALTIAHSGPPPRPPTGWWRTVEFPIFTDRDRFHQRNRRGRPTPRSGLADIQGVDPVLHSRFEGLQPFHHGTRAERQPLAVLHALSIRDKHQTLPLVAIASHPGAIAAKSGSLRGRSRALRVPAPIQDGAVIARLRTLSGFEATAPSVGDRVEIKFEAKLDFDVGFASGPPAFGGQLVSTLRRLHRAVAQALRYLGDPALFAPP